MFALLGKSEYGLTREQVEQFADAHIPVFISEYGNNSCRPAPRTFEETAVVFSKELTQRFSGGIVYEFFENVNQYGLVKRSGDGGEAIRLADFENLKQALAPLDPDPDPDLHAEGTGQGSLARGLPDMPIKSKDWPAETNLPTSPVDWDDVQRRLERRRDGGKAGPAAE